MTCPDESASKPTDSGRGHREVPFRIAVLAVALLISAATIAITTIDFLPIRWAHMSVWLSCGWSLTVLGVISYWFVAHNVAERRRNTLNKRTRVKVDRMDLQLQEVLEVLRARGEVIHILEARMGLPRGTVDALVQEQRDRPEGGERGGVI